LAKTIKSVVGELMKADKVALVTGGSRGIGRAVCLGLAEYGWSVAFCYKTSELDAKATMDDLEKYGTKVDSTQCDISDPEAAEKWVLSIEEEFGHIDALVNCAGTYHRVNLMEETVLGWNDMFDNNLHPLFYLSRSVIPVMAKNKWGRIISFSMANAEKLESNPYVTAHYIAKAGIIGLMRSFATLVAPDGITANTISLGFINSGGLPADEISIMAKRIPAGYVGDKEDVVSTVKFLLSDEAKYINGANLQMSGAWGV
jgi:3-oxoacyl-[acyl-carrier protein] reductase